MEKARTRGGAAIFALLAALALSFAVMVPSAFADTYGTDEVTLDSYLVMDKNANVPPSNFTYRIASGTAVPAVTTGTNKTPAVMAGVQNATLKYGTTNADAVTVTFAPGDTTYDSVQSGDTVVLATNKKYASKTLTVDLTKALFVAPGIYRYTISQYSTSTEGITYDSVLVRYLDVYVITDDAGKVSIDGYILHNTAEVMGAAGGVYSAKDGGFTNAYATQDLSFSKKITGNQGFRSKYFTFEVDITNAVPGTKYKVNLANATATVSATQINPAELTVGTDGSVTGTFYLTNNESIDIYGITESSAYTVSEDAEDYTPSWVLDGDTTNVGLTNTTNPNTGFGKTSHTVAFTNYRNGVVPTGVLLDIAPYAAALVLVGAVVVAVLAVRRRRGSAR